MRIGIDASDMVSEHLTGVEYSLTELVRHLPGAGSEDDYVLYFNFVRKDFETRFEERVRPLLSERLQACICRIPNRAMQIARRALHVPIDWFIGACDVVYYPSFAMHPQMHGAKVVAGHDLMPITHAEHYPRGYRELFGREVRAATGRADAILSVSHYTKLQLIERLSVAEHRIFVVPHGVNPHFRAASAEAMASVRVRYRLPPHYVLFVGTEEPRKNVPLLIEAARIWRARGFTDIDVVLAGKRAWGSAQIDQAVDACGLGGAVHRLGHIAWADLPAVYSAAEAFVLPSIAEGFGMPLLEAMACGVPAIAADATALPEVAGDAAMLFDPSDSEALADALRRVLGDSAERAAIVRRGFARAASFTWQDTARKTRAVFQAVAER